MITETYKGRKIRIVKGRGRDFGYSRVTLNGTELGKWLGDEARVLQSLHGYIDVTDRTGINGDKYGAEWYAPGTFELCENGHPKEIGGECLHSYCIERRPAPEPSPAVTEYSVKIWYRSGAYEGVAHCPGELARKIFADAVESAGVEFAELHGPSGLLVESKTPNEERPVSTEPNENLFIAHLPQLPEPLPPAPLNVSHSTVEDLTAAYSAQDPAEPTA